MKFTVYSPEQVKSLKDLIDTGQCEQQSGPFKPDRCYVTGKVKRCKRCFKYEVEIKLIGEVK